MRPFNLSDEEIAHIQKRRALHPAYIKLSDRQMDALIEIETPTPLPATYPRLKVVTLPR